MDLIVIGATEERMSQFSDTISRNVSRMLREDDFSTDVGHQSALKSSADLRFFLRERFRFID